MNANNNTLTADVSSDIIRVIDSDGGVWYPDERAECEIRESSDPEAAAVAMCQHDPHRGVWHS